MRALAAACLLLGGALLTGCSGSRPRPSAPHWHPSRGAAAAPGSRFHDDINRPQASRYRDSSDSVPAGPPPDISALAEPVPRVEPRSLYGNKSPYTVLGRTYRVLPTARGYDERGIASFYGNKFHGYKTSNLENYDMYAFTAASKVLPLPSYARVTNLDNGKSVIVRINDRGPFHAGRVIDLSYVAAVKIGIWPRGTGRVEVQGIDPGQPLAEPPPPPAVTDRSDARPGIFLQVGAFADVANAERVAQRLRDAHFAPVQVIEAKVDGHVVRRVVLGPLPDRTDADRISERIERMGLPRPQVALN